MEIDADSALATSLENRLISENEEMRSLCALLPRLALSRANVLILGESGTGKELVARLLHESGPRSKRKFVAINCAAVPESLLESELFGHERGSFTGAGPGRKGLIQEADGGTLFLDEIGDMPLSLQAKLLRVLQERSVRPVGSVESKSVDFRLVAATHRDLRTAVKERTFRDDLYFRLNVVPISIPPLRRRKEDIPLLARSFLDRFVRRDGIPPIEFSPEAIECLVHRRWVGNVRELENLIERIIVLKNHGGCVLPEDLPPELESDFTSPERLDPGEPLPTVEQLVENYILHVYRRVGRHQGKASEILGLSRRTLYRKLKSYSSSTREGEGSRRRGTAPPLPPFGHIID